MAGRIAYYGNIVKDGLVLDLDAAKRDSYLGSGISWRDISGGGNNGTLVNGPTYNSNNYGSIVFDGIDDVGNIGPGTNYPYPYHTFEIWVKTSGLASGMTQGGLIALDYGRYVTINSGGNIQYTISTGPTGTLFQSTASNKNVFDNNWHHIICSRGESIYQTYIDGILMVTGSSGGQPSWDGLNIWSSITSVIANNPNNSIYKLKGSISIVRMYNRQLTQTEVLQNYNATKRRYGL